MAMHAGFFLSSECWAEWVREASLVRKLYESRVLKRIQFYVLKCIWFRGLVSVTVVNLTLKTSWIICDIFVSHKTKTIKYMSTQRRSPTVLISSAASVCDCHYPSALRMVDHGTGQKYMASSYRYDNTACRLSRAAGLEPVHVCKWVSPHPHRYTHTHSRRGALNQQGRWTPALIEKVLDSAGGQQECAALNSASHLSPRNADARTEAARKGKPLRKKRGRRRGGGGWGREQGWRKKELGLYNRLPYYHSTALRNYPLFLWGSSPHTQGSSGASDSRLAAHRGWEVALGRGGKKDWLSHIKQKNLHQTWSKDTIWGSLINHRRWSVLSQLQPAISL